MKLPFNIGGVSVDENLRRRKSRRKMAWISLYSILGLTLLLLFCVSETKLESLASIVDTVFFCLSSIVLAYCGAAVIDDSNIRKHTENMHCKTNKIDKDDKKKEIKVDDPDEEK